ncbi:uncharacterized protein LOC113274296 isoform X2 [Papaver somniferum]|uniref:uncharacterized protein LOC113274296 isoform X2 n=1 Tax=Papaver somniferum TaxID=3469 RepID=UPI000E6FF71F|nr:uncharacterized protein LOC113274296 isoform X2 [Papaver somniferum]
MAAYSTEEDVALIRAYCVATSDPIIGRDMEARVYWARILGEFRAAIDDDIARNTKSIQNRISNLKKYVKRYVGHVRARCWGMASGGHNVATAYRQ